MLFLERKNKKMEKKEVKPKIKKRRNAKKWLNSSHCHKKEPHALFVEEREEEGKDKRFSRLLFFYYIEGGVGQRVTDGRAGERGRERIDFSGEIDIDGKEVKKRGGQQEMEKRDNEKRKK